MLTLMPNKMTQEIILSNLRMERKKLGIFLSLLFFLNTQDLGPKFKTLKVW